MWARNPRCAAQKSLVSRYLGPFCIAHGAAAEPTPCPTKTVPKCSTPICLCSQGPWVWLLSFWLNYSGTHKVPEEGIFFMYFASTAYVETLVC